MTKKSVDILCKIYEAIGGLCSEQGIEAFDHFYKGGGNKMEKDFQYVLKEIGVKIEDAKYHFVQYYSKAHSENRWGICTDPNDPDNTWVLTGMKSKAECEKVLADVLKGEN